MQRLAIFFLLTLFSFRLSAQTFQQDSMQLRRISNHILTNYQCYKDLEQLCKQIGHRLSGSPQAAKAVEWGKAMFDKIACDSVWLQEVMVPHWVRGEESAQIIMPDGTKTPLLVSSLGNAVGTGADGMTAEIIKVDDIDELHRLNPEYIKGKIVFYNFRFDQTKVHTFEGYGPCVYYRWGAPSEASKLGAVGVVIRSVSTAFDDKPHTGSISYDKKYPSIPAVAISNKHADQLEQWLETSKSLKLYVRTTCEMLPDVLSHNVVAQINGSERPDEIICFGGHLDSWDIGEGAHDDGAGVVQAIEVLRVFKELGIKPKRTVRAVLFMNEENGLRGANRYAELAELNGEKHIVAIESDAGGATPFGFSLSMNKQQEKKVRSWRPLLFPYGLYNFEREGGGADIGPLKRKFGTPMMGLMPDSQRYFDMHHSANDVFENVHRRELSLGSIAMAQMVYLLSMYGL